MEFLGRDVGHTPRESFRLLYHEEEGFHDDDDELMVEIHSSLLPVWKDDRSWARYFSHRQMGAVHAEQIISVPNYITLDPDEKTNCLTS